MRISDWSSDVCSSDLPDQPDHARIITVSANELQLVKTEVAPTSSVHPFRAADLSIHYKLHATLAVVRPQNSRRADNAACSRPQRRAVPALVPGLSAAFGDCA